MIFDTVIYVTLINLTEMEYFLLRLLLNSYLFFFLFMRFRIFNFGQIKLFLGMKTSHIFAISQM